MNTHELRTIKSLDDCSEFLGWLREHSEIDQIQGFTVIRSDDNRISAFGYGQYYSERYWASCAWMYANRRMLNDWIRTQLSRIAA